MQTLPITNKPTNPETVTTKPLPRCPLCGGGVYRCRIAPAPASAAMRDKCFNVECLWESEPFLTTEPVLTVRQAYDAVLDQPRPEWVRGICPTCSAPVVANCYYVGGRGYQVVHECWRSLDEAPTCSYRKIL